MDIMSATNISNDCVKGSGLRKLHRLTQYSDPLRFTSIDEHLRPLFEEVKAHKASDVYIQEGKPIAVLVKGQLIAITWRTIEKGEAQFLLQQIAGQTALSNLSNQMAVNTTFGLFDSDKTKKNLAGHRVQDSYRVNASGIMIQGVMSFQVVLRAIPSDPYHFSQIGLKEEFVIKCCPPIGIVYIAGVTGSGKSTTLASIIRYILENNTPIKGNIISHEEPIEFTYDNIVTSHSIVVQSQIPECFKDFRAANREAMRRKPAAIIVGEIRDKESVKSAIEASVTGHPVFATVHAGSVVKVVSRLVSQFDKSEQTKALFEIISSTAAIISQRLVPKTDGNLMAVQEYVFFNKEIRDQLYQQDTERDINLILAEHIENSQKTNSNFASPSFAEQGRILFENGTIGEEGLRTLTADE